MNQHFFHKDVNESRYQDIYLCRKGNSEMFCHPHLSFSLISIQDNKASVHSKMLKHMTEPFFCGHYNIYGERVE